MTANVAIVVNRHLYEKLRTLARRYERPVAEIISDAVELQYGDSAEQARARLIDRLARLEARIGDPETIQDQVVNESRRVREL